MITGALDGLKVLDLTRILAGPFCTMMLGDMGADVVKLESAKGDDTRAWGPPYAAGESAYFLGFNRNKRSIVVDLSGAAGRDVLGKLMLASDVVVENFKPGTLERWGFSNDWLEREAPRTIRCSITGYGAGGPKSDQPGYDFVLQAETGLMSITGDAATGPVKHGVAIVDLATGYNAAIAILAALAARERTGRGQAVAVSLYETGITLTANVGANHLISGKPAGRYGNGHPNIVPYRTFATADGEIALAVGNDRQFARLAAIAGREAVLADGRFATNSARVTNRAAVDAEVAAWMAERPTAAWVEALLAEGIPCGRIASVGEALADPQTSALGLVEEVAHPSAGPIRVIGSAINMAATPTQTRRPPPRLGEHTLEVLAGLGLTRAEIERLLAAGVVHGLRAGGS